MTHAHRILVTPRSLTRSGHPALSKLESAGFELVTASPGMMPSEAQLAELLPGCDGYLAGVEQVPADVLRVAADRGLKVISRNGSGVSNLDLDLCEALGIEVLRVAGGNARGVAELAFGFMLSLARSIVSADRMLKQEQWERIGGRELAGSTLGIIGFGNIGRMVAKLAESWEMNVIAHDVVKLEGVESVEMNELICAADIVSLHCPPAPDGRLLVDDSFLSSMKTGSFLVNTARAELVNEAAILRALDSGTLGGYATDVLAEEPPSDWSLARHPKVVATPHVGAFTKESVDRCAHAAVDQLLEKLAI